MMNSQMKVGFNPDAIADDIRKIVEDPATMTEINQLVADMCDPYVPYQTGRLANDITVTDKGVTYNAPYAATQYANPNHNTSIHPLASGQWDKAMLDAESDTFLAKVAEILSDRLNKG